MGQTYDWRDVQLPKLPNIKRWHVYVVVAVVLGGIFLWTGAYTVATDEVGVIKRFGKYVRTAESGLHFKIPFGVETVQKVRVRHVFKEEFGFATARAGVRTTYRRADYSGESLMLTGDLNSAVIEWVVQYKVKDAREFLYNIRNVRETLRDAAEATMRLIVGDRSVTEVLTVGRIDIAHQAEKRMQDLLDDYEAGIEIVAVKLKDVNPPDPVKPAFNEVNQAKQEREKMINEAWAEYNSAVPAARGEAKKTISEAEGYAARRVNRANGDAAAFAAVLEEYEKAPEVTRRRLYLEMMNEVLPGIREKYVIDPSLKGLIPLLNLNRKAGIE